MKGRIGIGGRGASSWAPPTCRRQRSVRESISVPFLAGVHPSRCANLCYADNSLAELYAARNSAVADSSLRLPEAQQLRALNLASEMFHVSRLPQSWAGLIDDLSEIIGSVSPAMIVLPHPLLESHADHCFAAVAAVEAVRQSARGDIRFLFYVVHPRANESHPLGPAGSAASFAPNFGQALEVSGVYSQWLSARAKLEAPRAGSDERFASVAMRRRRLACRTEGIGGPVVRGHERMPAQSARFLSPGRASERVVFRRGRCRSGTNRRSIPRASVGRRSSIRGLSNLQRLRRGIL